MPKRVSVAEQNDSAFTPVNGALSSTPGFSVLGVARAGTSGSGVGTWLQGTYGELLINADGTFTYRLNNEDPDTQVLASGQIAEERFTYTYSSGGGSQQDSITIEITGVDEPGQQVTTGTDPIAITTDATITALQRLEMGWWAVAFTAAEYEHITLTNEGSIHAEAAGSSAIGVEALADYPWNDSATLVNLGLIEAHAGPSANQAIGASAVSGPGMDNAIIVNHGVIRAISDATSTFYSQATGAGGARIVNTGTIEAISTGEAWAVELTMFGSLENSGFIYAEGSTAEYARGIVGVRVHQAMRTTINNSGTIHAVSTTAIESVGITMFRDSTNHYAFGRVNNSGTIVADIAVQAFATSVGGITGLHFYNSGHVEGAFDMDLGLNILFNQAGGEWIGAVRGGIDGDAVRNRGRIDGAITLGDGRDLFDGRGGIQTGTVSGDAGDDTLLGGNGADNLAGGDGADYIAGSGGADSLAGGAGGDVFALHAATDSTSAAADTITDFQTGIDRLDLGALAPSSVSLAASGAMTIVTANTAGGTVTIRVSGTIALSDIVTAPKSAVAHGTGAAETLFANFAGSQLYGFGGDDVLEGSAGADRLDGGTGRDLMRGGAGNDVYYADDFEDHIVEFDGEGVDELRTSASQRLQGYVENLTMLGSFDIFATGNDLDNVIVGNSGWNEIFADRGDDVMTGGAGADSLFGGEGRDLFVYLAATDSVQSAADNLVQFETGDDRIDLRAVAPTSVSIQETMLGYWHNFAITNLVTVGTAAGTMTISVEGKLFRSDFILGDEIVGTAAAESLGGTVDDDVVIGGAGNDILTGLDGADMLSGQEDDDRLDGGAGADTMTGGPGDDVYIVDNEADYVWEWFAEGYDVVVTSASYTLAPMVFVERLETANQAGTAAINLSGNTQDNLILGNAGNNVLDGGVNTDTTAFAYGGIDTLVGGGGDDVLIVDGSEDIVVETVGGGRDTVIARYSYVLTTGAAVESMVADQAGIDPLDLTGNQFGQTLRGNSAVNNLDGRGGADTFLFAAVADSTSENTDRIRNFVSGVDKIDLSAVSPTSVSWTQQTDPDTNTVYNLVSVQTAAGAMSIRVYGNLAMSDFILSTTITGTPGNDVLTGTPDDDTLAGLAGNDFLDGGSGADSMNGGAGNDTYVVDNTGDLVVEVAGAGSDTVRTAISFTLGANIENLTLTGAAAINGTGNTLVNVILGNSAANFLNGGIGADTMQGGAGNDTYIVDNALDRAVELNAADGIDTVQSSVAFTLIGHVENLILNGGGTTNGTGNAFANSLTGNAQANTLDGGAGADAMAGGFGNDTYIVDNAGDLVTEAAGAGTDLVRSTLSHTLSANVENLVLTGATSVNGTGNALVNSLTGNGGANVLDGGAGADTMNGGAGNDNYIVDDSLDRVFETSAANGTDTVQASVDYVLGANIENLILTGGSAIDGTGNALANTLTGNNAANILNGFSGADIMRGYGGDDTYIVDNAGDIIGETPGNGTDTVQASVGYTLAPNVENLILTGTVAINGTGNAQNNALTGNIAANVLKGGFGNDVLSGGDGNDSLFGDGGNDLMTGGAGADRFTFQDSLGTGNADHVADFATGSDKILLENAIFASLGAGPLNANAFVVGTAAADASDRIIYDAATGKLYYDSDGNGAGAALLFATLDNIPAALAASDFLVI